MHFLSLTYISECNLVHRPIPSVHLKIPFRREKFHHSLEKKAKKIERREATQSRGTVYPESISSPIDLTKVVRAKMWVDDTGQWNRWCIGGCWCCPARQSNDSFFPPLNSCVYVLFFFPFFVLSLFPRCRRASSLLHAALLFASRPRMNAKRRQNYCSQSRLAAPLFGTLLCRQLTRNSATQRYTRVRSTNKKAKKRGKKMHWSDDEAGGGEEDEQKINKRRKEGEERPALFGRPAGNAFGSAWKGFMTIRWSRVLLGVGRYGERGLEVWGKLKFCSSFFSRWPCSAGFFLVSIFFYGCTFKGRYFLSLVVFAAAHVAA